MSPRITWHLVLALVVFRATPLSAAESLDEVVRAYTAARGGLDAWHAAGSLELTGRFQSFSQDEPFTARWSRPDFFRFETVQQARPLLYGRDTGGSWWQVGLYEHGWPRRAEGPDAAQIGRDAEFEPALLDFANKGHRVELLPPGEVDGQATVDLRLTRPDGSVETWHLDPKTHLEVAIDSSIFDYTQTGDPVARRTYFSDFRPVAGLVLPFQVDAEYKSRYTSLHVATARVGAALSPEAFRLPLSAGMEVLRPFAGHWTVTLELQPDPRQPWQTVEFSSTITAFDDGALLEERYQYEDPFQGPVRAVRWLSWDRFHDAYRFTHYDPGPAQVAVFEGALTDGQILVSNEATNSATRFGDTTVLERYRTREISAEGWKTDGEVSTDGGKTWTLVAKFTYRRQPE